MTQTGKGLKLWNSFYSILTLSQNISHYRFKHPMENNRVTSILELFLCKASEHIEKKQFSMASSYILLAISEFVEEFYLIEFLSNNLKKLTLKEILELFRTLSEETDWLENNVFQQKVQHSRIIEFKRGLAFYAREYAKELKVKGKGKEANDFSEIALNIKPKVNFSTQVVNGNATVFKRNSKYDKFLPYISESKIKSEKKDLRKNNFIKKSKD